MTQRAVVQVAAAQASAASSTDDCVFSGALTDGNSIYAFVATKATSGTDPVVTGVTATPGAGSPVAMARSAAAGQEALQAWLYEAFKTVEIWEAHDLDAETYTIEVTVGGTAGDAGIAVGAIEVSGPDYGIADIKKANTGNVVASFNVGPTISLPDAECLAIALQGATDGSFSDIGFTTISGWTQRLDQPSGTSGKPTLHVQTKALDSAAALTVTLGSSTNDQYGRAGILLVLNGSGSSVTYSYTLKVVAKDASVVGLSGIDAEIHLMPVSTGRRGSRLKFIEDLAFESATETIDSAARAVMYIDIGVPATWEVPTADLEDQDTLMVDLALPDGVDFDLIEAATVGPTVCTLTIAEV